MARVGFLVYGAFVITNFTFDYGFSLYKNEEFNMPLGLASSIMWPAFGIIGIDRLITGAKYCITSTGGNGSIVDVDGTESPVSYQRLEIKRYMPAVEDHQ